MLKSEPYQSSPPISEISQPIPHRSQFISQQTTAWIIEALIDKAINRVHKNQVFRENLKKFSKIKTISNIDQISNLNFYESSMYYSSLPNNKQPRALYIDSLLPISADIDKQNSYKKRLEGMIQSQLSEGKKSKNKSISKKQTRPQYFKLDFETKNQQQQDGFTKELRKMQQEKQTKILQSDKAKKILEQQQRQKIKQKKKEKQQKFSYDYNGSPLKIKTQSKVNLISKTINGNLNKKTQLVRQVINDINPTSVDSIVLNQKKNLLSVKKRQDAVQFQDNRSLAEGVSVGYSGIKYTYQGRTFQAKKKIVSTMQLKKTLSNRRLNREEFERVKSMNGASIQLISNEEDFRNTKHARSQSQVNLKKGEFKKPRQIQKIIVVNDKLKEKLLQRVNELMEQVQIQANNPQKKYQYVSQMDIFNMNYLKGGKQTKNDKILDNLSTERSLILPKINSTIFHKGKSILPKQRERIKQIKTVVYDIRKKYDERLQY